MVLNDQWPAIMVHGGLIMVNWWNCWWSEQKLSLDGWEWLTTIRNNDKQHWPMIQLDVHPHLVVDWYEASVAYHSQGLTIINRDCLGFVCIILHWLFPTVSQNESNIAASHSQPLIINLLIKIIKNSILLLNQYQQKWQGITNHHH